MEKTCTLGAYCSSDNILLCFIPVNDYPLHDLLFPIFDFSRDVETLFSCWNDQDRLCLKEGHMMRETRGFMKDFIAGLFGFGSVCCCGGLGFFSRKCLLGNVLSLEHVSEMVDKCLGAFF